MMPGNTITPFKVWHLVPIDKVVHFLMFGSLTLILTINILKHQYQQISDKTAMRKALTVSFSYSVCTELMQAIVPNRHPDVLDGLANLLGCLTGLLIFWLIYKYESE
jgi:VanZ family protein